MDKEKLDRLVEVKKARKKPLFVRKDTFKKSRLGRKRKKKQVWRRAKGRDSKIREKRRGYRKQPSIGYATPKAIRGLVAGLKPRLVYNVSDLSLVKEDEIVIVGKVGQKKKIEIAKKAVSENIKLLNLNAKKFLAQIEKEKKEKEEKKKAKKVKKKEVEKEKKEEKPKEKEKVEKVEKKKEKEQKAKEKPEEKKQEQEERKEKTEKEKILKKEIEKPVETKAKMPKTKKEIYRKALEK